MDVATRFFVRVNKNGPKQVHMKTRCWVWLGALSNRGYGRFKLNKKSLEAHRVAWFIEHGSWPTPCALHECDNPACVRPSHLREGTKSDNAADRGRRGRTQKGDSHSRAVLTSIKVLRDRKRYRRGGVAMQELADRRKVSREVMRRALRGITWKHVSNEVQ